MACRTARPATGSGTSISSPIPRSPGSCGPGQAGLGHAPLSGGPGVRRGGDPHPAAPARWRSGPAVRHAPQRARHRPLPAHRPRALSQAAAGGRIRSHLRDREELPQRGHLAGPQPRVHHDGAVLGLCGLQRHHGVGGEHDPGPGPGGRSAPPRSSWGRTRIELEAPVAAAHHRLAAAGASGPVAGRHAGRSAGGQAGPARAQDRGGEPRHVRHPGRQGAQARRVAGAHPAHLRHRLSRWS